MSDDPAHVAGQMFSEGFNCAQCVLAAFSGRFGMDRPTALKIASGFGGGIARMQETCGAVTGAAMVIGLGMGYTTPGDHEAKEKTIAATRKLAEDFKQSHGTLACSQLLRCSLVTEEGKQFYRDNNLSEKVCLACIRDAVALLEEIL